MTGTNLAAAWRVMSQLDTGPVLQVDVEYDADHLSKIRMSLKAVADESRTGTYACCQSSHSRPDSIPGSSSTTKTTFRSFKARYPVTERRPAYDPLPIV